LDKGEAVADTIGALLFLLAVALAVSAVAGSLYFGHRFWRWVFRGLRSNMRNGGPKL
jgi:hypothetical protein